MGWKTSREGSAPSLTVVQQHMPTPLSWRKGSGKGQGHTTEALGAFATHLWGKRSMEDPGRKLPISCQTPMREDGHVKPLALSKCCQAKSECLLSTY